MSIVLENGRLLTRAHEGMYIRLDGPCERLDNYSPRKGDCHRLHHVWADGVNLKKHGAPPYLRPLFMSAHKLNQRVEIFTLAEFEKLPE